VSITSDEELEALKRIGRVVALTLAELQRALAPGMTTADLDALCAAALARHGARPTPKHTYHFPGSLCVSVNDEIVHGIPGGRKVRPGDVVKLDVTADLDGYVADAARTAVVPPAARHGDRLAAAARAAFDRAMHAARAGTRLCDLGREVEREARRHGYRVVRDLCGHGVGRAVHEPPDVPNYFEPRCHGRLTEGLVVAVEPILCAGSGRVVNCPDGWTVRTADRSLSAHHENTVVITRGEPIILTAA
jgi:methionyl aminopeptidase